MAWYGLFALAGTPPEIVNALNTEVNRLITAPDMADRWNILAYTDMPIKTPEQFAATVKRDIADWGAIVRAGNIKADSGSLGH